MTVIDLSVPLAPDLPCTWPGHDRIAAEEHVETGATVVVRSRTVSFDEHTGTHADTPRHFTHVGDPEPAAAVGPVVGRARIVDATSLQSERPGHSVLIAPPVLLEEEARSGPVSAADVVLIQTGWSDRYYRSGAAGHRYLAGPVAGAEPGWPVPSVELLALLGDRGVRTVGIDAPSIGAVEDPAPQHLAALAHGLTPIENLIRIAALRQIVEPMFVFLPLALGDATGLPGRAVGIPRAWSAPGGDVR